MVTKKDCSSALFYNSNMPTLKRMSSICFAPKTLSFAIYGDSSISPPSSSALTLSEAKIDAAIETAEPIILKWDPRNSNFTSVTSLFYGDKAQATQFLKSVNGLHEAMLSLASENSASERLIRAQNLMDIAMERLQKELRQILFMNQAHLDPESISVRSSRTSAARSSSAISDNDDDDEIHAASDSISEVEQVSAAVMSDLRSIAECMISTGYSIECFDVYRIIRKAIIDEAMYRLNVENLNPSQINKMDWQVLDMKIKNWLEAVKISMRSLFHGERILCDKIFSATQPLKESCFAEIAREAATRLFRFPELVLKSKKSHPEKMFRLLDMYTSIGSYTPEIESIFSYDSTSAVRSQALTSLIRLGESILIMLSEFETMIHKDPKISTVDGGGVHPLTVRTMNYLTLLADYGSMLYYICAEWSPPAISSLTQSSFYVPNLDTCPSQGASTRLAWLIIVLLCNLDRKAEQYEDLSLSYLFLANNLQHVITRVRTSNLKYMLGDDWIAKQEARVKEFAVQYESLGWGQVYSSLPENPKAQLSPAEAKAIFRNFSFNFSESYRKQKLYAILDPELREDMELAVSKKVLPLYREFYEKHRQTVGTDEEVAVYVRFAPEDVKNYLSILFFGGKNSGSESALNRALRHCLSRQSSHR